MIMNSFITGYVQQNTQERDYNSGTEGSLQAKKNICHVYKIVHFYLIVH